MDCGKLTPSPSPFPNALGKGSAAMCRVPKKQRPSALRMLRRMEFGHNIFELDTTAIHLMLGAAAVIPPMLWGDRGGLERADAMDRLASLKSDRRLGAYAHRPRHLPGHQRTRSSHAPKPYTSRTDLMAKTAAQASRGIPFPPPASDWAIHRGLLLRGGAAGHRN